MQAEDEVLPKLEGDSGSCGREPIAVGCQGGQMRGQCRPKLAVIQETTPDEEGQESKKTAGEQDKSCLSATLGGC